jgi:hypothetical protein
LLAELAAREGGGLPLGDAVALVALYARLDDDKFEPAAVRWLARYALERQPTLGELQPEGRGYRLSCTSWPTWATIASTRFTRRSMLSWFSITFPSFQSRWWSS